MNPFPIKRLKALLIVQITMLLCLSLFVTIKILASRVNTISSDLLMLGVFFLFISVHISNLLYNFKLLKVYKDEDGTATFNKSFSILLLIFYIAGFASNFFIITSTLYDLLTNDGYAARVDIRLYVMLFCMSVLAFLNIWISILQIKLLRLLKRLQTARAEELVAKLGAETEDRRQLTDDH
jgi:hypothetical protein